MSSKMIMLRSSDGEWFEVDEAVAMELGNIKHLMEDLGTDKGISLHVTSKTLSKVIEYCKKHAEAANHDDKSSGLKAWDAEYMKVDISTLLDLIQAANYLNIESLTDLTWQAIADIIRDNTVEEIREIFNVKHYFTSDEEQTL